MLGPLSLPLLPPFIHVRITTPHSNYRFTHVQSTPPYPFIHPLHSCSHHESLPAPHPLTLTLPPIPLHPHSCPINPKLASNDRHLPLFSYDFPSTHQQVLPHSSPPYSPHTPCVFPSHATTFLSRPLPSLAPHSSPSQPAAAIPRHPRRGSIHISPTTVSPSSIFTFTTTATVYSTTFIYLFCFVCFAVFLSCFRIRFRFSAFCFLRKHSFFFSCLHYFRLMWCVGYDGLFTRRTNFFMFFRLDLQH